MADVNDNIKIWVVMPAFNEEENISAVIKQIKNKGLPVIVIDDGSDDKTYSLAQIENADVLLRNSHNLGKGFSLKRAISYIFEENIDCDAVIIMDADSQHLPEEIDLFVDKLSKDSFFVVGNRLIAPENMPWLRILTNKIMSFLISNICGQRIPDTQCGFKGIRVEVLRKIKLKCANYEIDSELILESASLGYRIDSVPIASVYRTEYSNINPILDTFRFILFLFRRR